MDSCREKGVAALLVLSSGFADVGRDGTAAQRRLVTEARAHGMRVIGPNALGVANTDPAVRLNATLAPDVPGRGRAGFFAQSGALGIAILAAAKERGLGLSTFVSAATAPTSSGNDLLQYWQTDPAPTGPAVPGDFGNPRKFAAGQPAARTKPVIAVKSGRHTERTPRSRPAPPRSTTPGEVAFEQAGVIRVDTLSRAVRHALLLSYQPLPRGSPSPWWELHRARCPGQRRPADEGLELAAVPADVGATPLPSIRGRGPGRPGGHRRHRRDRRGDRHRRRRRPGSGAGDEAAVSQRRPRNQPRPPTAAVETVRYRPAPTPIRPPHPRPTP